MAREQWTIVPANKSERISTRHHTAAAAAAAWHFFLFRNGTRPLSPAREPSELVHSQFLFFRLFSCSSSSSLFSSVSLCIERDTTSRLVWIANDNDDDYFCVVNISFSLLLFLFLSLFYNLIYTFFSAIAPPSPIPAPPPFIRSLVLFSILSI